MPLTDGATLDWDALSGKKLTISAETAGKIGSVRFDLARSEGQTFKHVENNAPYALMSDHADRFIPYDGLKPGKYKLVAVPFAEDEARGGDGKSMSVKFEIVAGGGVGKREPIVLRAADATLDGPALRVDGDGERRVLTDWTDDDATATWRIAPPAAGLYAIELVYACDGQNAGGEFELMVGDHRVTGSIYGVEGGDRFRAFKSAEVALPKDKMTVTLRALKLKDGRPLVTLKEIRLTPVK
jgi:hypothetical protein